MKKNIFKKNLFPLLILGISISSCSKLETLDEETYGNVQIKTSTSSSGSSTTIGAVYGGLNGLITQSNWFAFQEHSTDELLGPTRGTDWDDFGTWRKIHLHTWDANHNQVIDTWNSIYGSAYQATLIAEGVGLDASTKAEGKFLRAYFNYLGMDLFGQVPYRAANASPNDLPVVLSRSEAFDWIIKDLTEATPLLPDWTVGNKYRATQQAAGFLLAKLLLNKAVYKQSPTKPAGPFTYSPADMNQIIQIVDLISSSNKFSLTPNYWDNFKWDNFTLTKEFIFGRSCDPDAPQLGGDVDVQWLTGMGSHYNDWYGGWNGFTTTSDFYNSFAAGDIRKGSKLSNYAKTGFTAGFRVGQQYTDNDITKVKDRSGSPLIFTPEVSLFFSTEAKGIRTNKYPLNDDQKQNWSEKHDYYLMRYSDLLLMKAEAILRGGTATGGQTPLNIVNIIRARSGASPLPSVDLTSLLAERGRELYMEGWRRQDLIRFEKFNEPVIERSVKSEGTKCVLPIPTKALASNPNLKQNPGY